MDASPWVVVSRFRSILSIGSVILFVPGPSQMPNGLLTMRVDVDGHVTITLGKAFYSINPDNSETQWMYGIRDELERLAVEFVNRKSPDPFHRM